MSGLTNNSVANSESTTSYSSPPQFSLRTILLIFVVISVLLAPVSMFGMHYAISMLFSLGLLAITWQLAVTQGPGTAFALSIPIALIGLLVAIASLPFFFHTLCNIVACLLLIALKPKPKVSLAILTVALLIPFAFHFNDGIRRLNNYYQLRAEYPITSIEDRLSPLEVRQTSTHSNAVLSADVTASLNEQETEYEHSYTRRVYSLEKLHDDSYRHFVASAGFGFSRMGNPFSPRRLELDPPSAEQFPLAVSDKYTTDPSDLHNTTIYDFSNAERIGYVHSPQQVAGFEGHAFTRLPRMASHSCDESTTWELTQLQLVSLLRHETPVAYITETLPAMQGIEEYPHRALNAFEENALPQLRTQREVVIDEADQSIQMLGAVRAGKSCLECHTTHQRGDLLGAFSYVLSQVSN